MREVGEFLERGVVKCEEFRDEPARFLFWIDNKQKIMKWIEGRFRGQAGRKNLAGDFMFSVGRIRRSEKEAWQRTRMDARDLEVDEKKELEGIDASDQGMEKAFDLFEEVRDARNDLGRQKAESAYGRTVYWALDKIVSGLLEKCPQEGMEDTTNRLMDMVDQSVQDGVDHFFFDVVRRRGAVRKLEEMAAGQKRGEYTEKQYLDEFIEYGNKVLSLGKKARESFNRENDYFQAIDNYKAGLSSKKKRSLEGEILKTLEKEYLDPVRDDLFEMEYEFNNKHVARYEYAVRSHVRYMDELEKKLVRGILDEEAVKRKENDLFTSRNGLWGRVSELLNPFTEKERDEFMADHAGPLIKELYAEYRRDLNEITEDYDPTRYHKYVGALEKQEEYQRRLRDAVERHLVPRERERQRRERFDGLRARAREAAEERLRKGEEFRGGKKYDFEVGSERPVAAECVEMDIFGMPEGQEGTEYVFKVLSYAGEPARSGEDNQYTAYAHEKAEDFRKYLAEKRSRLKKRASGLRDAFENRELKTSMEELDRLFAYLEEEKAGQEIREKGNLVRKKLEYLEDLLDFWEEMQAVEDSLSGETRAVKEDIDREGVDRIAAEVNGMLGKIVNASRWRGNPGLEYLANELAYLRDCYGRQQDREGREIMEEDIDVIIESIDILVSENYTIEDLIDKARERLDEYYGLLEKESGILDKGMMERLREDAEWNERMMGFTEELMTSPEKKRVHFYVDALLRLSALVRMMENEVLAEKLSEPDLSAYLEEEPEEEPGVPAPVSVE